MESIEHNIAAHDGIAGVYDVVHGEIFNPIEQMRLHGRLAEAIGWITSGSAEKTALDHGCGSGNLTRHLLDLGLRVVAADVSKNFLKLIATRFDATGRVETKLLNGRDMSDIPDSRFDMAAVYSVLHHVPDYLGLVRELSRVVKSGGVVFIDHEHSESLWNDDPRYDEFMRLALPPARKHWSRFFIPSNYLTMIRRKFDPRYQPEGDIHVWSDDHIEWKKVIGTLTGAGCEILFEDDYLLFRKGYRPEVYEAYKDQVHDTHLVVARKR